MPIEIFRTRDYLLLFELINLLKTGIAALSSRKTNKNNNTGADAPNLVINHKNQTSFNG
ncbi:hypothetical protein [Teredinibacter turnerae]|uniref:hypothetical protein n=1 Tax=Teredinibacter turnerae TaxID=2426 RepID=UPI00037D0480|nr:hypothetical protein [Teredinibacter turnerae]